jgi:signal transduction histidine kinase
LGRNISFLVPKDLIQAGELRRLKLAGDSEGVVYNHPTRRLRKDGHSLWMSLTRTVLHDRQGAEIGVIATLRDVSEQRAHEEELQRSRRLALVGELAAKIAHEVKNPLTGIYAALQVLEGHLDASDPNREVFQSIGEEVMRLNGITQELLQFSRPTEPHLRKADLGRFLRDLVEDLQRLSMVEPGELCLVGLEPKLLVSFDSELTGQIFKNLILNGAHANSGKGRIRISSRRSEGMIAIDVADDGPGIAHSEHERVFEPFFTTKSRGTGLGLSIARKNIELQGGSIRLRSQRGQGATFRVEFPSS